MKWQGHRLKDTTSSGLNYLQSTHTPAPARLRVGGCRGGVEPLGYIGERPWPVTIHITRTHNRGIATERVGCEISCNAEGILSCHMCSVYYSLINPQAVLYTTLQYTSVRAHTHTHTISCWKCSLKIINSENVLLWSLKSEVKTAKALLLYGCKHKNVGLIYPSHSTQGLVIFPFCWWMTHKIFPLFAPPWANLKEILTTSEADVMVDDLGGSSQTGDVWVSSACLILYVQKKFGLTYGTNHTVTTEYLELKS